MATILRNILACVIGVVLGGSINMALNVFGSSVIPPPAGVDVTDPDALSSSMHLFEPKHFVVPFLAHALGTLSGSLIAFLSASSHKTTVSFVVGALFQFGGIAATFMIPAPVWFIILDLVVAYIPMAWLGAQLGYRMSKGTTGPPAS